MKRLGYLAVLAWLLAFVLGCGGARPRSQTRSASADGKYHFLPGGIRTLAEGHAPHGPTYAISVLRYRFQNKLGTDLQAQMEPHGKTTGASGNFSPRSREPYEWTTEQGCSATIKWSIVYGLLRDPRDRGVLSIGAEHHRLRTVQIPARFHLRGALGYAALARNPTRVIVRDAAGNIVQDDDLGRGLAETLHAGREQQFDRAGEVREPAALARPHRQHGDLGDRPTTPSPLKLPQLAGDALTGCLHASPLRSTLRALSRDNLGCCSWASSRSRRRWPSTPRTR